MFKGRLPTERDNNDNPRALQKKITQLEREIDRISRPLVYLNDQINSIKTSINQIRKEVGKEDPKYLAAKEQFKELEARFIQERENIRKELEASELLDQLQVLREKKAELEGDSELSARGSVKKRTKK